jgi:hypothetical protein
MLFMATLSTYGFQEARRAPHAPSLSLASRAISAGASSGMAKTELTLISQST